MHRKAIWKPGMAEIAEAFRGFAPGPHKGSLPLTYVGLWPTATELNPSWKTGQQKCLDKALLYLFFIFPLCPHCIADFTKKTGIVLNGSFSFT